MKLDGLAVAAGSSYLSQLHGVLREVFVPPRRFDDPSLETRFLREFRQSGLSALTVIYLVGSVWVGFMLISEMLGPGQGLAIGKFEVIYRIVTLAVLLISVVTLIRRPSYLADHYWLLGILPLALCLLIVGGSTLIALEEIRIKAFRVVASFVIASIATYVTTRARVGEIAPWVVLSNLLVILGFSMADPSKTLFVALYLTLSNLIGWFICVYIERRERALFAQALDLERLSADLILKAAQASQANQDKDKLLQVVAHDLRQPIASLQLHIARLNALSPDAAGVAHPILQATACISMLQEGVDRLLEPPKRELQVLRLAQVDVEALLARVRSVYPNESDHNGTQVRFFRSRTTVPAVMSNEESMWHVLNNLIANAHKFRTQRVGRKPIVLVAVTVLRKSVRIDVVDNGRGIPREHIPLVFEAYWRGHSIGTESPGSAAGLGLGLAIVREAIRRLSGHSVWIDSKLGVGTRVRLYVPRAFVVGSDASEHPVDLVAERTKSKFEPQSPIRRVAS